MPIECVCSDDDVATVSSVNDLTAVVEKPKLSEQCMSLIII